MPKQSVRNGTTRYESESGDERLAGCLGIVVKSSFLPKNLYLPHIPLVTDFFHWSELLVFHFTFTEIYNSIEILTRYTNGILFIQILQVVRLFNQIVVLSGKA